MIIFLSNLDMGAGGFFPSVRFTLSITRQEAPLLTITREDERTLSITRAVRATLGAG